MIRFCNFCRKTCYHTLLEEGEGFKRWRCSKCGAENYEWEDG